MTIQTRLKLTAIAPLAVGSALLLGWFLTIRTLNQAVRQEQRATDIVKAAFELNVLAYEYASYPSERPRIQWNWRSQSLQNMLSQMAEDKEPATEQTVRRLTDRSVYSARLFETLARMSANEENGLSPAHPSAVKTRQRVTSQLLNNSQSMVEDAGILARAATARGRTMTSRANVLMVAFILFLAAIMTWPLWWLSREFASSLSALRAGLDALASGDLSRRVQVKGSNEFADISRSFNEMASRVHLSHTHAEEELQKRTAAQEGLRRLNETLEERVAARTAIAEQRAVQLRSLASELTLAEQRERRRIAQLLHDHLGQILVAAKMRASILASQAPDKVSHYARELESILNEAINSSRSLMVDLSPPILFSLGLEAAIAEHIDQLNRRGPLKVRLLADQGTDDYPEDLRLLLYQGVRELLFNVIKHADTDRAWVEITKRNECLSVSVEDDGVGFDPTALNAGPHDHFGLFGIRERAELLGGRLDIQSAPGRGTRVTISVPLCDRSNAEDAVRDSA